MSVAFADEQLVFVSIARFVALLRQTVHGLERVGRPLQSSLTLCFRLPGVVQFVVGWILILLADPVHDTAWEELIGVEGDAAGRFSVRIGANAVLERNFGEGLCMRGRASDHRGGKAIRMRQSESLCELATG